MKYATMTSEQAKDLIKSKAIVKTFLYDLDRYPKKDIVIVDFKGSVGRIIYRWVRS